MRWTPRCAFWLVSIRTMGGAMSPRSALRNSFSTVKWPKKSRHTWSNGTTVWPLYCAINKKRVGAVGVESSGIDILVVARVLEVSCRDTPLRSATSLTLTHRDSPAAEVCGDIGNSFVSQACQADIFAELLAKFRGLFQA